MRTPDSILLTSMTSDWHSVLNADGAPYLHVAARSNKLAIIKGLLLQKPGTLNERFGSNDHTLMHVIADSGLDHEDIIEFSMRYCKRIEDLRLAARSARFSLAL